MTTRQGSASPQPEATPSLASLGGAPLASPSLTGVPIIGGSPTIGSTGGATTYIGGSIVTRIARNGSFTFGDGGIAGAQAETADEIQTAGLTAVASHLDPVGTRYEISMLGTLANPNLTIAPDGGATITGPGGVSQATQVVNVQGAWRALEKQTDGNWLLSGL